MRGIRQVRRKKSSLSEVKLVVLGAPGVGKSGGFIIIIIIIIIIIVIIVIIFRIITTMIII